MPRVETPARTRVLDLAHLEANVTTLVVAAMEAGMSEPALLRLCEERWNQLREQVDDAEAVAALHVRPPNERPYDGL